MNIDPDLRDRALDLLRDLHRHPELSWNEHRTASKVTEFLEREGIAPQESRAKPGLLVDIEGARPGRRVFLRGDMDALPIHEESAVDYPSTCDGVMHACGHDVHTTSLVLVATLLHRHRETLSGSFRLAFQPAEEIQPSGAEAMIAAGEADGQDAFLALHCDPLIPLGQIGYRRGAVNAAVDTVRLTVRGRGGHGSRPHHCVDPVRIGALLVTELHHLVGREVSAHDPTVLTLTVFHAGDAHNIIPDEALLKGTLRTYDEEVRATMKRAIHRVCEGIALAHGAQCDVEIQHGHSNVKNDDELVDFLEQAVAEQLGERGLFVMPAPTLGGDDFACYGDKGKQLLFRLGVRGPEQEKTEDLHSPRFRADPRALPLGATVLAAVAARAGEA